MSKIEKYQGKFLKFDFEITTLNIDDPVLAVLFKPNSIIDQWASPILFSSWLTSANKRALGLANIAIYLSVESCIFA